MEVSLQKKPSLVVGKARTIKVMVTKATALAALNTGPRYSRDHHQPEARLQSQQELHHFQEAASSEDPLHIATTSRAGSFVHQEPVP